MNPYDAELRAAFLAGARAGQRGTATHRDIENAFFNWYEGTTEDWPIEDLGLPTRGHNALKREGVHTVGQLRRLLAGTHERIEDVYLIKNVGFRTVTYMAEQVRRFDAGERLL